MNTYFLDTGYVLALELANDQNHAKAKEHWQRIRASKPRLLTNSYVFAEIVMFLNHRGYHAKATKVGNSLLSSLTVDLVQVGQDLFDSAWGYFQQHADKTYSLTDCASFVLMGNRNVAKALTFDRHFLQAGFQIEP
jgi:predicted nucleic acid-binding protein